MPMYRKVNKEFFKKWTSEMAYVLGFFAADGYVTHNKRGGHFWSIQITDKRLLEKIRTLVGSGHKISKRDKSGNRSATYRLQIGSKEMYNDLLHLGMLQGKTKVMVVPNVPKKLFGDFVRGYFDGDGNVWVGLVHKERKTTHKVIQVAFTSGSFEYLKSLHKRLKRSGLLGGSLFHAKKGNYARLAFSVQDASKLFNIMYNTPHKLYLTRKKVVFEQFFKSRV